jgi:hypothetical protein
VNKEDWGLSSKPLNKIRLLISPRGLNRSVKRYTAILNDAAKFKYLV